MKINPRSLEPENILSIIIILVTGAVGVTIGYKEYILSLGLETKLSAINVQLIRCQCVADQKRRDLFDLYPSPF